MCLPCVWERYYVPLTSAVNNGDEIRERRCTCECAPYFFFFYVATATIVVFLLCLYVSLCVIDEHFCTNLGFKNRYEHSILGRKMMFFCLNQAYQIRFLGRKERKKKKKDSKIEKKK